MNLAPPVMVENVSAGDPIPEIGSNKDFEQSIAGLQKGAVSHPVALPPNRVVLAGEVRGPASITSEKLMRNSRYEPSVMPITS